MAGAIDEYTLRSPLAENKRLQSIRETEHHVPIYTDVSVTGGTNAGGTAMVVTAIRETELTSPYDEEKVIPPSPGYRLRRGQ